MPLFKIQRKYCPLPFKEIDEETPLMPELIAQIVVDEASDCVGEDLPKAYAAALARKVREFYRLNPKFRRQMRSPGDSCRDRLYGVIRHWLTALLHIERPDLHGRLPKEYAVTYGARQIRSKCRGGQFVC